MGCWGGGENCTHKQLQPNVIPWSLLNTNELVPPAEDGSDVASENNNLAYIGGQKSKEVITTKVRVVVTSRREGEDVASKVNKGGFLGWQCSIA